MHKAIQPIRNRLFSSSRKHQLSETMRKLLSYTNHSGDAYYIVWSLYSLEQQS